jgi:hypothetical protein
MKYDTTRRGFVNRSLTLLAEYLGQTVYRMDTPFVLKPTGIGPLSDSTMHASG